MCSCLVAPPGEGFRSSCGYVSSRGREPQNTKTRQKCHSSAFERLHPRTHRRAVCYMLNMFRLSDPFTYNCLDVFGFAKCSGSNAGTHTRCLFIMTGFSFKKNASSVIQFALRLPLFIPDLAAACPSLKKFRRTISSHSHCAS